MRKTSLIAGAVGFLLFAGGPSAAQDLPQGPGRDLVYGQCRTCHDLQYLVESAGVPRATWNDLLDSMAKYGMRITPQQRASILEYLATYLGPNPPKAAPAGASTAPEKIDGAGVFNNQCAACHQANGDGVAGQFPPLARNRDIFLSMDYPARVVLFGLKGKISVNGKDFDSEMPPLDFLTDAQIAAAIVYVRGAWGNSELAPKDMTPLAAATVAKLRQANKLSAEQVYAERKKLKGAAVAK